MLFSRAQSNRNTVGMGHGVSYELSILLLFPLITAIHASGLYTGSPIWPTDRPVRTALPDWGRARLSVQRRQKIVKKRGLSWLSNFSFQQFDMKLFHDPPYLFKRPLSLRNRIDTGTYMFLYYDYIHRKTGIPSASG